MDAATSPTRFVGNRHARSKAFNAADLNDSARRLFSVIDELVAATAVPGYSMLTTLQSDLFEGCFPEMLAACFADPDWDGDRRYCLGEAVKADEGPTGVVGRLVIEATPGQVGR